MNGDQIAIIGIIVLGPFFWCGIIYLIAKLGGWAKLSKHFATTEKPTGKKYRFRGLSFGSVNYPGITYSPTDSGLYIAVPLFSKLFHPPLLIPWDQFFNTSREQVLWRSYTQTYMGSDAVISAKMPHWMAEVIEEHQRQISPSGEARPIKPRCSP